jgi:VWFA-related protein
VLCLQGDQQVVLRSSVHLVEVSIVATANGAPVTDLSGQDLLVFDNGREQTLASFERVDSLAKATMAALPPGAYSNRIGADAGMGKTARPVVLSMILLDAVNTKFRTQIVARRAVADILEQLHPGERVAIYALGSRLTTIHDFSSDKDSLLARLRAYHGEVSERDDFLEDLDLGVLRVPCSPTVAMDGVFEIAAKRDRILDTLEALENIARRVKSMPGRKNLLWVSAGFPLSVGQSPTAQFPPSPSYRAFGPEMNSAMTALNDANISVYPIDARGLSCNPEAALNIATMNDIADATGGKAFANRNDLAQGVRAALDDSREVYLLSYAVRGLISDGAYHRIRVQTRRHGVQLRYRRGYYAPGKKEPSVAEVADRLTSALLSPLDVSEIGVQASIRAGDEVAATIRVDLADVSLTPKADKWSGALHLEALQTGAAGAHLGGVKQAVTINLEQATYRRALAEGLPFEVKFQRDPAAVTVRIGVVDDVGGRVGTVSLPLPLPGARR